LQEAAVALALVALSLAVLTAPAAAATATITGTVACRGGGPVVGIWVQYGSGGGLWAKWSATSAPWIARYSAPITVPSSIQLHIGCGGRRDAWESNNRTSSRNVSRAGNHSATCREAQGAPAQRCGWWATSILVGAPFAGVVNREGYRDVVPGRHGPLGPFGDWATDFYAGAGTVVRPRIYAPATTGYSLKIREVVPGCAGKTVAVGIWRGEVRVGEVSYAHLTSVPAFAPGQTITSGTALGRLKLWRRCSAWQVNSPAGVHTHLIVGTDNGTACYRPSMSRKPFADTRLLGIITPAGTASCA
jgi:hypothetical protein